MTEFSQQADRVLSAVQELDAKQPGTWFKRTDIAKALGHKTLRHEDQVYLLYLIDQERIELRSTETRAPSGTRWEYRLSVRSGPVYGVIGDGK